MRYRTNLPDQTEDAWLRGGGVWQTCRRCGRRDLVSWAGLDPVWMITATGIDLAKISSRAVRHPCRNCGAADWAWTPERTPASGPRAATGE